MKGLSSVGSKLAGVFKAVGTTLLNAFASAALSWGITKLGDGLKWIYDNWLTDNAKIEKELKKIEKANKNLEKSISDLAKSESDLANVNAEISKINDEISSIQSKGKLELTDEGDIDRLSRQASLLRTQQTILENNIKLQRESMAFSAKTVLDTGYTGKTYGVSDKSKVVSSGNENYSYGEWAKYFENAYITQGYNQYVKALSSGDETQQKLYKEAVDKNTAEIAQYILSLNEILQSFQDSEGNIISGYEGLYEEYTEIISNLQSLIDPNNFNQFILDWSKDEKLNYNFEEGFNKALEDMYSMEDFDFNELKSMNAEFFDKLAEQGISDSTIEAILNYKKSIYDSVLQTISDTYNVGNIPELKTSYLDNPNDTGVHLRTEDGTKIYDYVETRNHNDSEYDDIYEAEQKKFQETTEKAESSYDSLTRYVKAHPMETGLENLPAQYKHLKDLMGDNWSDDLLDKFTPEERQLAFGIEITDEGYDYNSLKEKLSAKISPIEVEVKPKASAAVDSMADMHTALNSLSELYNQTVLQAASENADNFATFAADPTVLNSIESSFKEFIKEQSESGNDVTELNTALEEFERIAVEEFGSPDYAEKMQTAIDELITKYIDQTKILDNLVEEDKEWAIAQLEAKGIINAEEVVLDRLTKTQKVSAKSWSLMTDAIIAYNDALDDNNTEEAEKQIENLTKYLNDAFKDETGITFDTDFVKENIDVIQDFINEVEGAKEKLQQLAAQNYILNLTIDGDNTALDQYRNQLADLIGQFDGTNIAIGASLDNHPVLRSFIEMAEQAGLTARDIQNALSKAGVKAVIRYKRIPKEMEAMLYRTGGAKAVGEYYNKYGKQIVDTLTYEPISKASTANYSAPSTTGGSSGGGGGGGSEPTKPKEESEEMFDWVEVAIQRIEEEISRLDKVVGNTYETWGERNEARIKEIKELEKEYKALDIASSEYFRNAEKVQVNGGKGLNDDDYGENDELVKENDQRLLDEAKAAWATGEYKKKVQQGLLTGDDIEKIANHFLSDTIKEYQEIYQKGVDAQDKEYDKLIELGNQYKGAFDDVKEEYSELIQYITDQADVIDERINRTEKRGYFVSKSYYEDLKALEAQRYSKLDAEYEDLIKKRDEAVASGTVEEGSEAWNKMNQEINATNLELEKSKTQMVEYNNTIRQLDWD